MEIEKHMTPFKPTKGKLHTKASFITILKPADILWSPTMACPKRKLKISAERGTHLGYEIDKRIDNGQCLSLRRPVHHHTEEALQSIILIRFLFLFHLDLIIVQGRTRSHAFRSDHHLNTASPRHSSPTRIRFLFT